MHKKRWGTLGLLVAVGSLIGTGFSSAFAEQEAAPTETKLSDIVGYKKGFYIQTPDERFKLKIGGYIQGLFLGEIMEGAADENTFRVRRARMKFKGHLYNKAFQYVMEYDFASPKMLTAMIQLVHSDQLKFRLGQFKVPFNVEGISSASTLQFVDRSLAHATFGFKDERDIGMGLHGSVLEGALDYYLAVMNGDGLNTLNVNNELLYVGRLVYNLVGKHGYKFADTKQSEDLQAMVGAAVHYEDEPTDVDDDDIIDFETKRTAFTGDLSAKYKGFSAHGAYFYQHLNPDIGTSADDHGFLAQLGYFIVPKHFEVAGRIVRTFADSGNDEAEYTAGLNYFIYGGHRVKFQIDYSALVEKNGVAAGNDQLNHRARAQLQVKL